MAGKTVHVVVAFAHVVNNRCAFVLSYLCVKLFVFTVCKFSEQILFDVLTKREGVAVFFVTENGCESAALLCTGGAAGNEYASLIYAWRSSRA